MSKRAPSGSNGLRGKIEEVGRFEVVLPPPRPNSDAQCTIPTGKIEDVVSFRKDPSSGFPQYLAKWKHNHPVYSWHTVDELSNSLIPLQVYIERAQHEADSIYTSAFTTPRKRKSPHDYDDESSRSTTPGSTPDALLDPNVASYGCFLRREKGVISIVALPKEVLSTSVEKIPTWAMRSRAARALKSDHKPALYRIRAAFDRKLSALVEAENGKAIKVNSDDLTSPSLDFQYVTKSIHGQGVEAAPEEVAVGCGSRVAWSAVSCRPEMGIWHEGHGIGCEYSRVCECLEFAAVDEPRLTDEDRRRLEKDPDDKFGLPKRFPYSPPTSTARGGCLVKFYMNKREPIYECNLRCKCGPHCKTRVVQKGRQVPLEIFRTEKKGWGLRCTEDLKTGQFIDTYRGEIITNEEADRREESAVKGRAIYLYTLDKFADTNGLMLDDCYVVDGEKIGGPTRFMNHSCEPNCRQYTVSYNKYDLRIYELAFFACRDIPAYTELTFDYLDKDEGDEDDEDGEDDESGDEGASAGAANGGGGVNEKGSTARSDGGSDVKGSQSPGSSSGGEGGCDEEDEKDAMICHCGAPKCRKKLFI